MLNLEVAKIKMQKKNLDKVSIQVILVQRQPEKVEFQQLQKEKALKLSRMSILVLVKALLNKIKTPLVKILVIK
jgi:hypothetical protein